MAWNRRAADDWGCSPHTAHSRGADAGSRGSDAGDAGRAETSALSGFAGSKCTTSDLQMAFARGRGKFSSCQSVLGVVLFHYARHVVWDCRPGSSGRANFVSSSGRMAGSHGG